MKHYATLLLVALSITLSCNNDNKKQPTNTTDTAKKTVSAEKIKVINPPTINILDTISAAKIVVYMTDSSSTMDGVGLKLGKIYAKIGADFMAKNKIVQFAPVMAWYKTNKAPYFFDAGIPVQKLPAKLPKGMFVKEIKTDSATVAHFFGPYNLLEQGYNAIKERLKENKKTAKGMPYEIYVGDPIDSAGKSIDPYKVRTDIVFPWH